MRTEEAIEPVLNLLDLRFSDELISHIDARETTSSVRATPLDIDPRIRAVCADLEDQLDAVAAAHRSRAVPVSPVVSPSRGAA